MNVTGTISNAKPVDSTDRNGNKYQWVTIDTPTGPIDGRIGSKQGYQTGTQITVTVENKQGQGGPYNYFKRVDPQYGQPTQVDPTGPPPTNGQKDMLIVREVAIKAVLQNVSVPLDMVKEYLLTSVQFILTGEWELGPKFGKRDDIDF